MRKAALPTEQHWLFSTFRLDPLNQERVVIATAAASKLGELRALKKRRKPSAAYLALTADSAGEPKAAELTA